MCCHWLKYYWTTAESPIIVTIYPYRCPDANVIIEMETARYAAHDERSASVIVSRKGTRLDTGKITKESD